MQSCNRCDFNCKWRIPLLYSAESLIFDILGGKISNDVIQSETECESVTFYLEPITLVYVPSTRDKSQIDISNDQYFVTDAPLKFLEKSLGIKAESIPIDAMWPYLSCTSRAPVLGQVSEQAPINHKIEIKQDPIHQTSLLSSRTKSRAKGKAKNCKKENVNLDMKQIKVSYQPQPKRRASKQKVEVKTKQITDYFPSQRSKRKTSVVIQKERLKQFEEAILSGLEDGYEVHETLEKGRCVVTNKKIKKGDFVLEYSGDLITISEAKHRELYYASIDNVGCYMYYFEFQNKQYCVDATKESHRLGRLVNHSKKGNLKTKPFLVENTPHLILVADRDIQPGEELLYDYGDRSKRSLEHYPWLAS